MENYRISFMMRRFNDLDTAEGFAEKVDGVIIYDRDMGYYIVRWDG